MRCSLKSYFYVSAPTESNFFTFSGLGMNCNCCHSQLVVSQMIQAESGHYLVRPLIDGRDIG